MVENEFNDILEKHEKMIYHLIHKLGIRDLEKEFYQEGIIALWRAVETYDPSRGKFSSYAYYLIHKALLSLIRKRSNQATKDENCVQSLTNEGLQFSLDLELGFDDFVLHKIKETLTANQMKWFQLFILEDLSVKEIAEREGVTLDAVKNWGRLARQKLKKVLAHED